MNDDECDSFIAEMHNHTTRRKAELLKLEEKKTRTLQTLVQTYVELENAGLKEDLNDLSDIISSNVMVLKSLTREGIKYWKIGY